MNRLSISTLLTLVMLFLGASSLVAQDLSALNSSMKARLPQIDAMKTAGVVGETNDGYLAPRESLSSQQSSLVDAENSDRRKVYAIIAERTNTSVSEVAQHRAAQIAQRSSPGVWLQDARGKWYQK